MSRHATRILRIGLGITFILLGLLIWKEPALWGSFLQSWAAGLVPGDIVGFMKTTAVLDMILGIWFIIGWRLWIPAAIASLHILGILITTTGSFDTLIVRDIGLLGATLALFVDNKPTK